MAVLRPGAFVDATHGIAHAWRTQRNLRVQVAIGIVALIVFVALRLPLERIALVVLVIAFVLAFEVMNTALEALVDLASPQMHPLAKAAKDAAAGAVLIAVCGAVAVGIVLVAAASLGR